MSGGGLGSQRTNEDERTSAGTVYPHETMVCRAGLNPPAHSHSQATGDG